MSNVHEAISKHSKKQHEIVRTFLSLDANREAFIEEAIALAKENRPFSVEKINAVTEEINRLAKNGIAPMRKIVTTEMVEEYVNRKHN